MSFVPVTGAATFRSGEPPRDGVVEFRDERRTVSLPVRAALPVLTRARAGDEVVFTRNTTDAFNLLARALPRRTRVVVFASEHHATLLPWEPGHTTRLPVPLTHADAEAQVVKKYFPTLEMKQVKGLPDDVAVFVDGSYEAAEVGEEGPPAECPSAEA